MCIDRGEKGAVEMHSPNVNIGGYEGLVASVARDEAASVPGTKSSTVTGDYRNSSFSSERSADNDIWPEIEVVQEWFAEHFCQPIYEAIIIAGVIDGYFDSIDGFTLERFNENRAAYLACQWQGPVARSINPVDDEQASEIRLRGGRSSPQRECATRGVTFRQIIHEIAEARQIVEDAGLPEVFFNSIMGLDTKDLLSTDETKAAKKDGGGNVPSNEAA
jgi:capsid protein